MKVINLTEDSSLYTSNVFLVLGSWNTIADVNTLIDVGNDKGIIEKIESINTGLGKHKVDQVILTHSHSDHSALLSEIKIKYHPKTKAFNSHLKNIDHVLQNGEILKIGDQQFEVFHITFHSYDSICLYCEKEGVLFSGDTSFPIAETNPALQAENEQSLQRLKKKKVKTVYPGHGPIQHLNGRSFEITRNKNAETHHH
jgi:glyoxylase-like metal-dependent hydrolase (beta-lactamase superfamily II)